MSKSDRDLRRQAALCFQDSATISQLPKSVAASPPQSLSTPTAAADGAPTNGAYFNAGLELEEIDLNAADDERGVDVALPLPSPAPPPPHVEPTSQETSAVLSLMLDRLHSESDDDEHSGSNYEIRTTPRLSSAKSAILQPSIFDTDIHSYAADDHRAAVSSVADEIVTLATDADVSGALAAVDSPSHRLTIALDDDDKDAFEESTLKRIIESTSSPPRVPSISPPHSSNAASSVVVELAPTRHELGAQPLAAASKPSLSHAAATRKKMYAASLSSSSSSSSSLSSSSTSSIALSTANERETARTESSVRRHDSYIVLPDDEASKSIAT